ncbi:MAG: ThuA domain-containing protein [Luteolibacter sp.]
MNFKTLLLFPMAAAQFAAAEPLAKSPAIPMFQENRKQEWYAWMPSKGRAEPWPEQIRVREDGTVHVLDIPVTGKPEEFGYFATRDDYRNYRLHFDYKWGEKKFEPRGKAPRNSGLLYHIIGEDRLWPGCVEYQVQEGDTGDFHLLWRDTRPTMDAPVESAEQVKGRRFVFSPQGEWVRGTTSSVQRNPKMDHAKEWNRCVLEVRGTESRHFVNGTLNNAASNLKDFEGKPLDSGRIAFQVEGAEIFYRNISIAPITWPLEHEPFRVLVFSKTEKFRHDSIGTGAEALRKLGDSFGFEVAHTENADDFTEEKLRDFRVVVFLSTSGDVLNPAQQTAFEGFIRSGGGFVGIHSACDTEYDWPWFGELVGAYFSNHPAQQTADLYLTDETSTSTSMLPRKWTRKDEWYNFRKNPDPAKVQVLLRVDESSYKGGRMGESHPISWQHEFDGGRSWFTALGHTKESFHEPLFLMHVLGGIQYAAGIPAAE